MNIEQVYRTFGIRNSGNYLTPTIHKTTEFTFPELSIFFFNPNEILLSYPSEKIGLLSGNRYVQLGLTELIRPIGKYKQTKNKDLMLKELSKISIVKPVKDIRLLKMIPKDDVIMVNTTTLNFGYVYRPYLGRKIDRARNIWNSMLNLSSMNFRARTKFIQIPLPAINMELFRELESGLKTSFIRMERNLEDDRIFFLIEIWKFLNEKTMETSVFFSMSEKQMKEYVIIFQYNSNSTLITLHDLFSPFKGLGFDSKLKLDSKKTRKLIFNYFISIHKGSPEMASTLIQKGVDLTKATDDILKSDKDIDVESAIDNLDQTIEIKTGEKIDEEPEVKEVVTSQDKLISKSDLYERKVGPEDAIERAISNGSISEREADTFRNKLNAQSNEPLILEPEQLKFNKTNNFKTKVLKNEKSTVETINNMDKKYIGETYKKDMKSIIYHLQSSGILIDEVTVVEKTDVAGTWEEYHIQMTPMGGKTSTQVIRIPKLLEDGTFRTNANNYIPIRQIVDLPIRKIKYNVVSISSYKGKLTISKAKASKNNRSKKIQKLLDKALDLNDGHIKAMVALPSTLVDTKINQSYTYFSRNIKSITVGNYKLDFDYLNRKNILKGKDKLETIETEDKILIGEHAGKYLTLDSNDILRHDTKILGDIYEYLKIEEAKELKEFASLQLFKSSISLALILSYQLGIDNLLSILKADYELVEVNKRIVPDKDDIVVKFFDTQLWIKNVNSEQSIILSGFKDSKSENKVSSFHGLNNKDNSVFIAMGLTPKHLQEINIMDTLFLDPITMSVLEDMKEPTYLPALFIRASEMLIDDNFTHTNNIKEMRIRSHERIPGLIYKHLAKAAMEQRSGSLYGKTAVKVNRFEPWAEFASDSTLMIRNDLNPFSSMKQRHEITYTGFGGRNIDTMTAPTREFHVSNVGTVSEASKDSGKVGATIYLTGSPDLSNVRGIVKNPEKYDQDDLTNKFSISALSAPFALGDDVKRVGFIDVQNEHVQGSSRYIVLPLRTGYETITPQRVGKEFCLVSKKDGVVLSVGSKIKVKYSDGETEDYSLKNWITKEESGRAYEHKITTQLKKGDKFKIGDAIYYDSMFFGPDMFNPKGIAHKLGFVMNTAYVESYSTHEDSYELTEYGKDMVPTENIYISTKVLELDVNVNEHLNIGDTVKVGDKLMSFDYGTTSSREDHSELLNAIKNTNIESSYAGEIVDIKMFYYGDIKGTKGKLKKLITEANTRLEETTGTIGMTGLVDNTFSNSGRPIQPGELIVKFYIRSTFETSFATKVVFGNQLKVTLGELNPEKIRAFDKPVHAFFSTTSDSARIVSSPKKQGILTAYLEKLTEKFLEVYDNEK